MRKLTRQFLEYIAANVRRRRLQLGYTQEQIGHRADVDPLYVQRVERASINLTIEKLVLLAKALGVTPGVLLRPAKIQDRPPGRPRTRKPKRR